MPRSPKIRIGIGVAVIFLAGMLCGGLLAGKIIAYKIAKNFTFENFVKSSMTEMDKRLTLTPEQRTKIEAVVRGAEGEFKEAFDEFGNILVRMHNRVHTELTPEQQRTHSEMLAEARKGLKEKMKITLPDEAAVPPRK